MVGTPPIFEKELTAINKNSDIFLLCSTNKSIKTQHPITTCTVLEFNSTTINFKMLNYVYYPEVNKGTEPTTNKQIRSKYLRKMCIEIIPITLSMINAFMLPSFITIKLFSRLRQIIFQLELNAMCTIIL